jgi:voltage-gated potassium channel
MRNLTRWLGGVLGALLIAGLFALPVLEQTYAPDAANIQDVGDTVWYALVTLTTVGYGDYYPVSTPGQIVGALFVLSSLGVLGLLIGKIADLFTSYRERRRLGHHGTDWTGHIVIFGWNASTQRIVEQIRVLGRQIVIVTPERDPIDDIHERFSDDVFPLYAEVDDANLLERVNLSRADRALLNIESDTDTLIYLLNLRKDFPDVEFVVAVQNEELRETFQNAGVAKVVSSTTNAANLIASVIFEPDVALFAQDLITTAREDGDYDLQQYKIRPGSPAAGRSYGDLFRALYEKRRVIPIGVSRPPGGDDAEPELVKLPPDDLALEAGDVLIVIASGADVEPLRSEWKLTLGGTA